MRGGDASGDVQDLSDGDTKRDLGDPGLGHGAGDLDQDRARESSRVGLGEARDAAGNDGRDRGEGLRSVDQRWHAEEAAGRGVGRLLLGLAALALEALEQDRLLAEHVAALQRPDREADLRSGAQDVTADVAGGFRGGNGRFHGMDGFGGLGPDRDHYLVGPDREGGDGRSLDDGVWVALEQDAVRHHGRVGLVGVHHNVMPIGRDPGAGAPLLADRESARAATAHAGVDQDADHALGLELLDRSPESVEGAGRDRRIQVERILRRRRREQEAWKPGRGGQDPGRGHDTLLPATVRAHAAAPDCETACGSPSSVTSGERAPGM